jgi:drug/metabolite transporter superfamily protein YnfA
MIPILRLIHIVFGVFWVGSVLFATFVLMPSIRAAGPAGVAMMKELGRRKLHVFMMVSAILTVGAGIWLMIILSGGAPGVWMRSTTGRTYAMGGGFAILALIVGMVVNGPSANRMGAIGAAVARRGGPPTGEEAAELERLQSRMGIASMVVAVLLLLATGAMAVARYLA